MPNFVTIGHSIVDMLQFFKFSRWRPSAIVDLFGAYLDCLWRVFGGLCRTAKFGYECSSFNNINILIFGAFG